ncbi:MAG: patatin-like phospholipase family protein [Pseudomonadota bacterium]
MGNESLKLDAVFEGGGVKGIGLVGAVAVTGEKGYEFKNVAGTSAGAIVASLIAAGYGAQKLKEVIEELDYSKFKDKGFIDSLPGIGFALSLGFEKGIYEGRYFENWLRELLSGAPNGSIKTFRDLRTEYDDPKYRYKLQVIAADVSRGKMLVLPHDIRDYGVDPDELDVALAVRMSMSIPFFYEPVILKDNEGNKSYIVDGGILSNYPVWIFDDGSPTPPWPTLGYKLVEPGAGKPNSVNGPITLFAALFSTMMEAHDARYIANKDFVRTIPIPTLGVRTTEFDLSRERSNELYESGRAAAEQFFQLWDFEEYKANYRQTEPPARRQTIISDLK